MTGGKWGGGGEVWGYSESSQKLQTSNYKIN